MNSEPSSGAGNNSAPTARRIVAASMIYVAVLLAFWQQAPRWISARALEGHLPSALLCFALLLAPVWFFGFGWATGIRRALPECGPRIGAAALFCLPYLVFSIPRHEFHWPMALAMAALPVMIAALLQSLSTGAGFDWRDAITLFGIAVIMELRLLSPAWPYPGLGSLPKLYLADVTLYAYLVVRGIAGMGYSFWPSRRTFLIAAREWLGFAPFGIGLGLALKFISFQPRVPSETHVALAMLATFLLTAVPEELFFRGILQNLLQAHTSRTGALVLASLLFGLSHFHKGAVFNWRYVLLASIAGVFYGRAWRAERSVLASSLTHTAVDVFWSLWFR